MKVMAIFAGGVLTALLGCATVAGAGADATVDAQPLFDGTWSVEWCDTSAPDLDCGGFTVTLHQADARICGEFGGALVNLRQVDEGDIVGMADGDSAMLEVRSGRNDSVVQVQARRVGEELRWKQLGTLRQGGADISVIAIDEVLKPTASASTGPKEVCRARLQRRG